MNDAELVVQKPFRRNLLFFYAEGQPKIGRYKLIGSEENEYS